MAYGFLFGVFPSLVAECFGVNGLSQNWGCMTLAPIVFGNIFNLLYGMFGARPPQCCYWNLIRPYKAESMILIRSFFLMDGENVLVGDSAITPRTG